MAAAFRACMRAAAFAVCALLALAGAMLPTQALAKDYSIPHVGISAQVAPDGALSVNEQRTFDFDGSFTCVWWTFDSLPAGSSLEVAGVSLIDASGKAVELAEVPFQTQWRSSGGPGYASYSVDVSLASVYVFFQADDEQLTVDLSYIMSGAAQAHSDVAELYWQYVGSEWAEASNDVDCTITLPVPAGVADAVDAGGDPVGRAVLDMLFDKFPAGDSAAKSSSQQHVWFGTINKYGKKHPEEFNSAMNLFQNTLSRRVDNLDYHGHDGKEEGLPYNLTFIKRSSDSVGSLPEDARICVLHHPLRSCTTWSGMKYEDYGIDRAHVVFDGPLSEALMRYWKCDDGSGFTIDCRQVDEDYCVIALIDGAYKPFEALFS